ncbi:hypothetical protein SASPL_101777 [Salvia splendens]|uniref:Uncharacterized protein n=1 Tax=Salvia splendens TaxID=180675 RepID=A0A8X9ACT4_SALSN|nr:hypothetical protein SASPL_101777 [Salvia splendens]
MSASSPVLSKENWAGETALYVAAEYGYHELVRELIQFYDLAAAGIKAKNGFNALHIAAKHGDLEAVKGAHGGISGAYSLVTIAKSNGKTALHSAARNGHVQVVEALLSKEPRITTRTDKKGQTVLHMAAKGQNLDFVAFLIRADASTINMVDSKGNTPLHIAARKGRDQI